MILRLTGLVALGVLIGCALWAIGMPLPYAIAFGILTGAGGMLLWARAPSSPGQWHALPDEPPRATLDDVSRVSWSLHSGRQGVSDAALIRVRRIAAARLEQQGRDPAGAGNGGILDERSTRALARASGMTVTRRQIEAILDQLDDRDTKEKP